jgi:hypothetical protein
MALKYNKQEMMSVDNIFINSSISVNRSVKWHYKVRLLFCRNEIICVKKSGRNGRPLPLLVSGTAFA